MKKPLFVVVAAAALSLTVGDGVARAGGDPRLPEHRGKGAHTAPAPNPFVVADPNDPSLLYPAPGFAERGFDGSYIQAFARPHVDLGLTADTTAGAGVKLRAPSPDEVAAAQAANPFLQVSGHVIIINGGAGDFDQNGNLDLRGNGLFDIAQTVLGQFGDQFDFITMFEALPNQGNAAAFYLPLKNDVQGLGACNFNQGDTFGCRFNQLSGTGINRLQGLIYMNSLSFWESWDQQVDGTVHSFDSFDQAVYAVLGQETAHRWGAALRFVDPRNGSVSKKLLGRDQSHWAAFVDTDASVMDGWDWKTPDGNGRFDLVNDMDVYSTLDLYTMGAVVVAAAKPFFFIDGAKYDVKDPNGFLTQLQGRSIGAADVLELGLPSVAFLSQNGIDLGATGQKVDLTIQDIVDAEGNRCPDPDHTQKSFRQAIVYVVRPGQNADQRDIANLETIASTWEQWWNDRTGRAISLCTLPNDDCKHAEATLGGGSVDTGDSDFIEKGTEATIRMVASASSTITESHGSNDSFGPDQSFQFEDTDVDAGGVKGARIELSLDGGGAKHATLQKSEISVGDVDAGKDVEVPVKIDIDNDYECGSSLIVVADIQADNAPDVREEYRVFPGYSNIFVENFASGKDDFVVNADGGDSTKKGGLERADVALNCDITPRTPEKDNTPGSKGAYVTGVHEELDGDTSLWSPEIDLHDTVAPELAYDFWFEGEANDSLLVQLSEDGKKFKTAVEETESLHGWGLERVKIKDVFGHIPQKVTARFIFNGHGHLEGGIDNVRVLDPAGQCRSQALGIFGVCGCSSDGGAGPQTALAFALGLLGLRLVRRRRPR